jgi:hypothetical protein
MTQNQYPKNERHTGRTIGIAAAGVALAATAVGIGIKEGENRIDNHAEYEVSAQIGGELQQAVKSNVLDTMQAVDTSVRAGSLRYVEQRPKHADTTSEAARPDGEVVFKVAKQLLPGVTVTTTSGKYEVVYWFTGEGDSVRPSKVQADVSDWKLKSVKISDDNVGVEAELRLKETDNGYKIITEGSLPEPASASQAAAFAKEMVNGNIPYGSGSDVGSFDDPHTNQ